MRTNLTNQLIMTTYPGFHDLPKGIKQMLQTSESFFFEESRAAHVKRAATHAIAPALPSPAFHHPPPDSARAVAATA